MRWKDKRYTAALAEAAAWNSAHGEGTLVAVKTADGTVKRATTRSQAVVIEDGSVVVWLYNLDGAYKLSDINAEEPTEYPAFPVQVIDFSVPKEVIYQGWAGEPVRLDKVSVSCKHGADGQLPCTFCKIEQLEDAVAQAEKENARLRAALELATPFLREEITNPDNYNCAYCDDDEGNHKDDCKQLVAYLACKEALKGGEQ